MVYVDTKRFRPGMRLLHLRSGRPVEVIEVGERTFTAVTLDDRWFDPRDGKEKGGCAWVLFLEDAGEFVPLEEGEQWPAASPARTAVGTGEVKHTCEWRDLKLLKLIREN